MNSFGFSHDGVLAGANGNEGFGAGGYGKILEGFRS